ncbi:MAG: gluconokinase [Rhodothermales bacterium]|nr:gluconokinase [Rhodothermales bacterium]
MGVAGSGKSTIGSAVAADLDLPFVEGDDLHPEENVRKMSAGIPLTDADRKPWIDAICDKVNRIGGGRCVVACSALSSEVRRALSAGLVSSVTFIFLEASRAVLRERLAERSSHYMGVGMLDSQLEALSQPVEASRVDANRSPDQIVAEVRQIVQNLIRGPL